MKAKDWANPLRKHLKAKGWARQDRGGVELWRDPIRRDTLGHSFLMTFAGAVKVQKSRDDGSDKITCQANIVDHDLFGIRKCSRKPKANGYCHQHRRLA